MSRIEPSANRSGFPSMQTASKKGAKEAAKGGPPQAEQDLDKDSILQTWEEIEQIRRENKELRDEIDTEARMNNLNGPVLEAKMEQIQTMSSAIAQKIEVESQKKRDLETLIGIAQDNISDNLKKLNENKGMALPQLQAKIKTLEYKLEKTRGRHNESLAQINMLKEEVNMVRRERVIFSNVFKKLESDIKLKDEEFKKFMIEKMHVEQRRKVLQEDLAAIKARAKKEVISFKNEYQQIFNQTRNNNTSLADQTNNGQTADYSTNKRIFDTEVILSGGHDSSSAPGPATAAAVATPANILTSSLNTGSADKSNARNSKNSPHHQTSSLGNATQNNTINLQATQEELQKYQFMFQKIQKEVGIDDLDTLIYLFENIEKENNDLYESANHKSDEIDQLKKSIKDVEKEVAMYSKHKDHKQKNHSELDKQQQDLTRLQKKIENTEMMTKSVTTDIKAVNTKLLKIAEQFNIEKPEGDELDEHAFTSFLKNVESRVNDIINMSLYCEGKIVNIDKQVEQVGTLTSLSKKNDTHSGIAVVLDGVKKKSDSEAERILSKGDFTIVSKEEIKQFRDVKGKTILPVAQKKKTIKN